MKLKNIPYLFPTGKNPYKKPDRLCLFCMEKGKSIKDQEQSKLKRHILTIHKLHPRVAPILKLSHQEQVEAVALFRKEAILRHNQNMIKNGNSKNIQREYKAKNDESVLPIFCTGCKGFFSKTYKTRHQKICTGNKGASLYLPLVTEDIRVFDNYSDGFKSLLNSMKIDEVSDTVKEDSILLMIGSRFHSSLKRKRDKKIETTKYVRSRLRLTARLYITYKEIYGNQKELVLENPMNNTADMFRREVITLLGKFHLKSFVKG